MSPCLARSSRSNTFCGPAALALLIGCHVDDAVHRLRVAQVIKHPVKGVYTNEILRALDYAGCTTAKVDIPAKPTLVGALRALKGRGPDDRYLVAITGHFVVIQGRKLFDNRHPDGVFLGACPYRRRRVKAIYLVRRDGVARPVPPLPMAYSTFKRKITAMGLDCDSDSVFAPHGFRFQDGLHGHAVLAGDYEGALERAAAELPVEKCPEDCDCNE